MSLCQISKQTMAVAVISRPQVQRISIIALCAYLMGQESKIRYNKKFSGLESENFKRSPPKDTLLPPIVLKQCVYALNDRYSDLIFCSRLKKRWFLASMVHIPLLGGIPLQGVVQYIDLPVFPSKAIRYSQKGEHDDGGIRTHAPKNQISTARIEHLSLAPQTAWLHRPGASPRLDPVLCT